MNFDLVSHWYHGSPLELVTLRCGSTITQKINLARIFAHKPTVVSISDDDLIKHNGTFPGYLYLISESITSEDVTPHPHTTMEPGDEWLTMRELRLELLRRIELVAEEQLTENEIAQILGRLSK